MAAGLIITFIGMLTVFLLLGLMISAVKILSIVFMERDRGRPKGKEEKEIAIALAALKNVLG